MNKIIKHYDKRAIEFAIECHKGGKVTWYFPRGSGLSSGFTFPSGKFELERHKHDSFDFELYCFMQWGHAHRELARSARGLPWDAKDKEALKEAAATPHVPY